MSDQDNNTKGEQGDNTKREGRFFDDVGKMFGSMMSSGMNSAMDARKQAEGWVDERVDSLLDGAGYARSEELDALRDIIRRLDDENRELKIRVDALEAK